MLYTSNLLREAIKYKSNFFSEEKEVRLLFDLETEVNTPSRDTLIAKRFDEKYFMIDYHDEKLKGNSIVEVVIGPKCYCSENKIKEILDDFGYDNIDIKKSCGSYR